MSDPTLVTQIITTGTASVSVIGSDGSGKSKVLTAAEVRTASETYSETVINEALSSKQATLVSGTNIKTVNSTSLLGSGDIAISSGTLADVIRSTDGNLSAAVNTWYHWDISGLTADRTLTLPAVAAVGDRVALTITTGDDAYEVLITAASGDTLATIAGGTEWSRLFATNEVVVMRCIVANTTWIIEYDGRIPQFVKITSATTQSVTRDVVTKISLATYLEGNQSLHDSANGRVKLRRVCRIVGSCIGNRASGAGGSVDTSTMALSNSRIHNASGFIPGCVVNRFTKVAPSDYLEYGCTLTISGNQSVDGYAEMHVFFAESASTVSNVASGAVLVIEEVLT